MCASLRQASELRALAQSHQASMAQLLEQRTQHLLELRKVDSDILELDAHFKRRLADLGAGLGAEETEALIARVEDDSLAVLGDRMRNDLGLEEEEEDGDSAVTDWNYGQQQRQ